MTFKNRIASYYLIAAATIIAVVFTIIYFIVSATVYSNLDASLIFEARKHFKDIVINRNQLSFNQEAIKEEREHKEAVVVPYFLQLVDSDGNIIEKSLNLKEQLLLFNKKSTNGKCFNSTLNHQKIRQVQIPITVNNNIRGYLLTAVSLEGTILVVKNLQLVLFVLFPIVLVFLFFITRYLAGKSIEPIINITQTTNRITRNNLNERIKPPETKDELYVLTNSINKLLERIQKAFDREKQFTNDASHELRTPLSVIKGTLEVLIRKPRKEEEYKEKINYCISEIDNMSIRVDQLLLLARFDRNNIALHKQKIPALSLIDNAVHRHRKLIEEKNIQIQIEDNNNIEVITDPYYADMILENIISNSIKYSNKNGLIKIRTFQNGKNTFLEIIDSGRGILEKDLEHIFNPFFRSESLNYKHVTGSGLGLSIVKKAAEVLDVKVTLENNNDKGVKAQIIF